MKFAFPSLPPLAAVRAALRDARPTLPPGAVAWCCVTFGGALGAVQRAGAWAGLGAAVTVTRPQAVAART